MVEERGDPDLLFAFAELSFLHGQKVEKPEYDLAAAVYAYAFLFPEGTGLVPGRFDPRLRIAADLYNWALTSAFASEDGVEVLPRGGTFNLPFGEIEVAFDPAAVRAGDRELYRFIPSSELKVQGLAMRYRTAGLGVPLAAPTKLIDASKPGRDLVAPRLKVPLTLLLRIPGARQGLVQGRPLTGTIELHLAWDKESVAIAGEEVPLENQPSAALALTFTDVPIMDLELLRFLGRLTGAGRSGLRSSPPRPIILGSSRWSSCTARRPARSAGGRCSTVFSATTNSGAAISSGSSSTIPAIRSRCPRSTCARP